MPFFRLGHLLAFLTCSCMYVALWFSCWPHTVAFVATVAVPHVVPRHQERLGDAAGVVQAAKDTIHEGDDDADGLQLCQGAFRKKCLDHILSAVALDYAHVHHTWWPCRLLLRAKHLVLVVGLQRRSTSLAENKALLLSRKVQQGRCVLWRCDVAVVVCVCVSVFVWIGMPVTVCLLWTVAARYIYFLQGDSAAPCPTSTWTTNRCSRLWRRTSSFSSSTRCFVRSVRHGTRNHKKGHFALLSHKTTGRKLRHATLQNENELQDRCVAVAVCAVCWCVPDEFGRQGAEFTEANAGARSTAHAALPASVERCVVSLSFMALASLARSLAPSLPLSCLAF